MAGYFIIKPTDMNFVDFLNNIWETSKERIKTPITGAYSLAFILYNWRPILFLLFSDKSIEAKIEHINATYCHWPALLWPLGIALFYVVGVPYVMMIIEKGSKLASKNRKQFKADETVDELEHQITIATKQYTIDLIKNGSKEQEELHIQIKNLQTQNESLTQQLKSSDKNLQDITDKSQQLEASLSEQIDLLGFEMREHEELESYILNNGMLQNSINKMDMNIQKRFVNFAKRRQYNQPATLDSEAVEVLEQMGFVEITQEDGIILTAIGKIAYNYIAYE